MRDLRCDMKARQSIFVLSVALVSSLGLAHAQSAAKPFTPSQLMARADELDGQQVTVEGIVRLGPETRCLTDRHSYLTLTGTWLLQRHPAKLEKRMILTGIFRRVINGPNDIDLAMCSEAGLQIIRVVPPVKR